MEVSECGQLSFADSENGSVVSQVLLWKDKYERLLLSFEDIQKTNQELEERLLTVVEKIESDKLCLSEEIDSLNHCVQVAQQTIARLEAEKNRYKADCIQAVHMLHCQPSHYVAQKLGGLSPSVVSKNPVLRKVMSEANFDGGEANLTKPKSIVQMLSFPPTAMVFHQDDDEDAKELFSNKTKSLISKESNYTNHHLSNSTPSDGHRDGGLNSKGGTPPCDPFQDYPSLHSETLLTHQLHTPVPDTPTSFVERIVSSEDYLTGRVVIATCPKCGYNTELESKVVQTGECDTEALDTIMGAGLHGPLGFKEERHGLGFRGSSQDVSGAVIGQTSGLRKNYSDRLMYRGDDTGRHGFSGESEVSGASAGTTRSFNVTMGNRIVTL